MAAEPDSFRLVYRPFRGGRSFIFPCDPSGAVQLDELSESTLTDYLLARALVGPVFERPRVVSTVHGAPEDA